MNMATSEKSNQFGNNMESPNQFSYKTVSRTILGDMHTPVGVYMRLRDLHPQSALMECSDYHDKNNSRSFVCIHPIASVAIAHGLTEKGDYNGFCQNQGSLRE